MLKTRAQLERNANLNNFDSGWALEDIVRDELRGLLPLRYHVTAGVISDRNGASAGDCDVVIFNNFWFPSLKVGPIPESRRRFFPIDGVYAVLEIKQSLGFKTLDDAMEKLVKCHRLNRPLVEGGRIVENSTLNDCTHSIRNPLYSGIIATDIEKGVDFDELIARFIFINQKLPRLNVVRALCVLGHGIVLWGAKDGTNSTISNVATFMGRDLYSELVPVLTRVRNDESAFYGLAFNLMAHLDHSVLAPEDLAIHYGLVQQTQSPTSSEIVVPTDEFWAARKHEHCDDCKH